MSQPTVSFITTSQFKSKYLPLLGEDIYYECLTMVDRKDVRNRFKTELKGTRLYKILITTKKHPEFKNIQNQCIKYKYNVFADKDTDGAIEDLHPMWEIKGFREYSHWLVRHPVGNVIIVHTETKETKNQPSGVSKPITEWREGLSRDEKQQYIQHLQDEEAEWLQNSTQEEKDKYIQQINHFSK